MWLVTVIRATFSTNNKQTPKQSWLARTRFVFAFGSDLFIVLFVSVLIGQSDYFDQSQQEQNTKWTNQKSKQIQTRPSKSRLVLVLFLIGWESGENFFNQSERVVKQTQSKHNITFDTQLKTALIKLILLCFLSFSPTSRVQVEDRFVVEIRIVSCPGLVYMTPNGKYESLIIVFSFIDITSLSVFL